MHYKIIATGSKGNAVVLNDYILVDCGVPFKKLKDNYRDIKIVLLTHIHSDHFNRSTIRRLARDRPTLRFGCCSWLVADLLECGVSKRNIDVYEIGKVYDYKAFKVSPIKLYHDVPQCGYRIFADGKKAMYATDTAHLQGISAKGYDLYLLEANYEQSELQERIRAKEENGGFIYEYNIPDRHLSKEQADEFIFENMGANSKYVYLHEHREE
jgi:ribonuclease BN (tRNA processing enzyme)